MMWKSKFDDTEKNQVTSCVCKWEKTQKLDGERNGIYHKKEEGWKNLKRTDSTKNIGTMRAGEKSSNIEQRKVYNETTYLQKKGL